MPTLNSKTHQRRRRCQKTSCVTVRVVCVAAQQRPYASADARRRPQLPGTSLGSGRGRLAGVAARGRRRGYFRCERCPPRRCPRAAPDYRRAGADRCRRFRRRSSPPAFDDDGPPPKPPHEAGKATIRLRPPNASSEAGCVVPSVAAAPEDLSPRSFPAPRGIPETDRAECNSAPRACAAAFCEGEEPAAPPVAGGGPETVRDDRDSATAPPVARTAALQSHEATEERADGTARAGRRRRRRSSSASAVINSNSARMSVVPYMEGWGGRQGRCVRVRVQE